MNEDKIKRINVLYHKSKEGGGLTEAEKIEQANLRAEYIQAIRNNMSRTLENVSLVNPDGTVTEVKKKEA